MKQDLHVVNSDEFMKLVKKYAPEMAELSPENYARFHDAKKPWSSGPSDSFYSIHINEDGEVNGNGAVRESVDIFYGKEPFPPTFSKPFPRIPGLSDNSVNVNWDGLFLKTYRITFLNGPTYTWYLCPEPRNEEEAMELFNPERGKGEW